MSFSFCGSSKIDPLLEENQFIYIGLCFQNLILWSLLFCFILGFGVKRYIQLSKLPILAQDLSKTQKLKIYLHYGFILSPTVGLIFLGFDSKIEFHIVVFTIFVTMGFIISLFLTRKELQTGNSHNYVLKLFFILTVTLSFIKIQNLSMDSPVYFFLFISQLIGYFFLNILTIYENSSQIGYSSLNSELELETRNFEKLNPEQTAKLFSKLTFSWLNALLKAGSKTALNEDHLYPLVPTDESAPLSKIFERNFKSSKQTNETQPLLKTLVRTYFKPFFIAGIFKLLQDILLFLGPVFLQKLILFVEESSNPENRPPITKGIFYAGILLIVGLTQSLCINSYFFRLYRLGMNIRAVLVSSIYRKSFKLTNSGRNKFTTGEITNLQSVDAQIFMELIPYLHTLWSSPLQIVAFFAFFFLIIGVVFLFHLLGPSTFVGILSMILLIPISGFAASKMMKIQQKLMEFKDQRMKIINEVLQVNTNNEAIKLKGIRLIKFFSWEDSFHKKIENVRLQEIKSLIKRAWVISISVIVWTSTPLLVSITTFTTYVLLGNTLTAEKAFTAIALFNIIEFPLSFLPEMINHVAEAKVSLKRLEKFFLTEELEKGVVSRDSLKNTKLALKIKNGSFSWKDSNEDIVLKNIDFEVKKGELVAIVGSVGSGKSSLLEAILGNMTKLNGTIEIDGNLSYSAQQPWIQNTSLKNNILFGKEFIEKNFENCIQCCELFQDLKILPGGVDTEIGEKGINLSGGQKQRVSCARAVYQDTEIYLFDDPLSAVDSHVGNLIFKNCIKKSLKNKTRIIVTHQIQYLSKFDKIIVLKKGKISEIGSYQDLINSKGELEKLISNYVKTKDEENLNNENLSKKDILLLNEQNNEKNNEKEIEKIENNIISEEEKEVGKVSLKIYLKYAKYCGTILYLIIILILCTAEITSKALASFWITVWVGSDDPENISYYLTIYAILGLVNIILIMGKTVLILLGCIKAAKRLHEKILKSILYSPVSFFDTTPVGRILNRFSKDLYTIDESLPDTVAIWLIACFTTIAIVTVITSATLNFLLLVLPLTYIYQYIQTYYLSSSRELSRLDSVSKSPIFALFSETLNGMTTIKAFDEKDRFLKINEIRLDKNQRAYFFTISVNRWLAIRLEFIGSIIVFFAAIFAVMARGTVDPGIVGLSLTYALQLTEILNWLVRTNTELETQLVSVERVTEYSNLVQEKAQKIPENLPKNWPKKGEIEFKNVSLRYREGLDLVLKNLNCKIEGQKKIGVVGRTGAGKSSLMLALFRIIECSEGQILIDDVDISKLGLHDLRTRISIIPQESTLFSQTIRKNLDPFEEYSDSDIWWALESVSLKEYIESIEGNLSFEVTEGGENLSVGQRQLICLARALLKKSKVLIMDEATAAVDYETDFLIQKTIRKNFKNITVLTIAHRIATILDYDSIMVLDFGEIKEYDTPDNLLKGKIYSLYLSLKRNSREIIEKLSKYSNLTKQKKTDTNSIFYSLVKESGHI